MRCLLPRPALQIGVPSLLESYVGRDQVLELIRREAGMELSFKRYPRNDKFILELRDKVNQKLHALQGVGPEGSGRG